MAGRVLSKENENKLRSAAKALADVLELLGDDAKSDEAREAVKGLQEAANLGQRLEATVHADFVAKIDGLFWDGVLTREERTAMLGAVEMALQSFAANVQELAPDVYQRAPWEEPAGDMAEAFVMESDIVPLTEQALSADGTALLKLIAPGWGSSGFYPAAVLERDGPQIFKAGTKAFWNHATPMEDAERPEGDLNALAAELVTDARWESSHAQGPGLYANAKVFAPYREAVNELAPHIGVSIRALGRATQGEAEGRKGPIIQALTAARSTDFVTVPGAGGKIVEMFEAARPRTVAAKTTQEGETVDSKELQEANARLEQENARLREAMLLSVARTFVEGKLADAQVPDVTKVRLVERLSANPPVKEGTLDEAAFALAIETAIGAEREYLAKAAGDGRVVGMGAAPAVDAKPVDVAAGMKEAFTRIGLSAEEAAIAAAGRNR